MPTPGHMYGFLLLDSRKMSVALMTLPCHESASLRRQRSSADMVHSSYDASSNVTTFTGHAILPSDQRGHHSLLGDKHKHII